MCLIFDVLKVVKDCNSFVLKRLQANKTIIFRNARLKWITNMLFLYVYDCAIINKKQFIYRR